MSLLQSVRSINTRMAACVGTYTPSVKGTSMSSVVQTGVGGIDGSVGSNTNGSGFGGFGAGGNGLGSGGGGGGGGGNLITYYVEDLADIIKIIISIRGSDKDNILPMTESELQASLKYLGKIQKKLSNSYTKTVDPKAEYRTIRSNILTNDIVIYILYFAYNFCDYQITQYQLIKAINNYQARYLKALQNNQQSNSGYTSFTNLSVNLAINTSIKDEYINYIKFYGIPKKGYFVPSILERINLGIINETNYKMFIPDVPSIIDPIDQQWVLPDTIDSLFASDQAVSDTFIDPQNSKNIVTETIDTDEIIGSDGKVHYSTDILTTDMYGNLLADINIYV
jgi:hypothetical protein